MRPSTATDSRSCATTTTKCPWRNRVHEPPHASRRATGASCPMMQMQGRGLACDGKLLGQMCSPQVMVNPPSTTIVCPVTYPPAGEASHTAVAANSMALPNRPMMIRGIRASR
jgi:hypothetical protein